MLTIKPVQTLNPLWEHDTTSSMPRVNDIRVSLLKKLAPLFKWLVLALCLSKLIDLTLLESKELVALSLSRLVGGRQNFSIKFRVCHRTKFLCQDSTSRFVMQASQSWKYYLKLCSSEGHRRQNGCNWTHLDAHYSLEALYHSATFRQRRE